MDIILLKDIEKVGYKFDVVTVKNGYGRNYLIPQGHLPSATERDHIQLGQVPNRHKNGYFEINIATSETYVGWTFFDFLVGVFQSLYILLNRITETTHLKHKCVTILAHCVTKLFIITVGNSFGKQLLIWI